MNLFPMKLCKLIPAVLICFCISTEAQQQKYKLYREPHRPQLHFSQKANWMNDPNGMVFFNNTYYLFYQYYPDSMVWGPMHWGHATSKNLVHWDHEPVALYPDSLGYIFSGSVVADVNNSSGFGKAGKTALVAIFTHHDPKGDASGRIDYQNQSIAYSLDEGRTWTKYEGNPVLKNPGIRDFRDPKVSWYEPQQKWIMTLATQDRISFYSSKDLKQWTKESEFGKDNGAHGGVWECPDLFPLDDNGRDVWVLLVSINPGGPNEGSATQYFIGDFDGTKFSSNQTTTKWLDYGPDDYAGVTWSNTGKRKIFLGWMGNWLYATRVPTYPWRSAMTIPRELSLRKIGTEYYVVSKPIENYNLFAEPPFIAESFSTTKFNLTDKVKKLKGPARLSMTSDQIKTFSIVLSNSKREKVVIGYDQQANQYYIDRSEAGIHDFYNGFTKKSVAPRIAQGNDTYLTLFIDNASVELFADNGLTVMTGIFFPNDDFTNIQIEAPETLKIKSLKFNRLQDIW